MNIASHSVPIRVRDGETPIGCTSGHGFLCWEREPGTATLISEAYHSKSLILEAEKGQVYYVLQRVHPAWETVGEAIVMPGGGQITATMELLDEEKGRHALAQSKPPK
jgi:hypothetical protein